MLKHFKIFWRIYKKKWKLNKMVIISLIFMLSWMKVFEQYPSQKFWISLNNSSEDKIMAMNINSDYIYFQITLSCIEYMQDRFQELQNKSDIELAELFCRQYYIKFFS